MSIAMRKHIHLGRSRCVHKRGGAFLNPDGTFNPIGLDIRCIDRKANIRHGGVFNPIPLNGTGHRKIKPLRFKF